MKQTFIYTLSATDDYCVNSSFHHIDLLQLFFIKLAGRQDDKACPISEAWDEATMPIPSPMDIGVALIRSKYVPGEWLSEYYTLCGQGNP